MKERPILFSAPMVRAILAGRKTQTRRVLKGRALEWITDVGFTPDYVADPANHMCPYGQVGDQLWVRESWRTESRAYDDLPPRDMDADYPVLYDADADWGLNRTVGKYRASMHMPRWASRIQLEITSVRVERLQDISYDDAMAEGIEYANGDHCPQDSFARLWVSINGDESWIANPWVWVVEFRRVTP